MQSGCSKLGGSCGLWVGVRIKHCALWEETKAAAGNAAVSFAEGEALSSILEVGSSPFSAPTSCPTTTYSQEFQQLGGYLVAPSTG